VTAVRGKEIPGALAHRLFGPVTGSPLPPSPVAKSETSSGGGTEQRGHPPFFYE